MAAYYDQRVQGNRSMSVIGDKFCVSHPTHLITKKAERFSDTIVKMMDANNNLIFEVANDRSTLRSQMVLFDAAGSPIATMRKKMFSWHTRWTVHKGHSTEEKDKVYSTKDVSRAFHSKTKLDVYLATNTSEETISDYRIEAGYSDLSGTVYKGDQIVAEIANPITRGGLVGKDELQITVNPDVDYAFIVTLVAILIEMRNIRSRNIDDHQMHAHHAAMHAHHTAMHAQHTAAHEHHTAAHAQHMAHYM